MLHNVTTCRLKRSNCHLITGFACTTLSCLVLYTMKASMNPCISRSQWLENKMMQNLSDSVAACLNRNAFGRITVHVRRPQQRLSPVGAAR